MALTGDMVRDLYAEQARPGAVLVKIEAEGLPEPFLATNWPDGLQVGADFYPYVPFKMDWPGSGEGEPSREAKLEIHASGEAVEQIRLATGGRPSAQIARVRTAAPDHIERALKNAIITSAEVSGGTIKIPIRGRDYDNEPAVAARYTQSRTPGLF